MQINLYPWRRPFIPQGSYGKHVLCPSPGDAVQNLGFLAVELVQYNDPNANIWEHHILPLFP